MNGITKQTRRQSYDGIRTRSGERCKLILETLGNRSMTVEEITDELVAAGHLKYYDRNFVAPRLTELKGAGVLEVVGKKPDCCHDQARSYRSNRHANGDGRQYENRPDRDRRIRRADPWTDGSLRLHGRRSGSGIRGNTSCSSYTGTESDRQASGS